MKLTFIYLYFNFGRKFWKIARTRIWTWNTSLLVLDHRSSNWAILKRLLDYVLILIIQILAIEFSCWEKFFQISIVWKTNPAFTLQSIQRAFQNIFWVKKITKIDWGMSILVGGYGVNFGIKLTILSLLDNPKSILKSCLYALGNYSI